MTDEPYRHIEKTVLIELKERDVNNLREFFDKVSNLEKTLCCDVILKYDLDILSISDDFLREKYGSWWDLYSEQVDISSLRESIEV